MELDDISVRAKIACIEFQVSLLQLRFILDDWAEKGNPDWPGQPRVPAGQPTGGQWTTEDMLRIDPPAEPVYFLENLIGGWSILSAREVLFAVREVLGIGNVLRQTIRIRRAAHAIEEYLGGKPERVFRNNAGDIMVMGNGKKVRFDINNFSPHDRPHFHVERMNANGRWVDDGTSHVYPFKED